MLHRIFSVFDEKAACFGQAFFAKTVGLAERQFMDAVNDDATEISRHPEDYTLWYLGTYNDEEGTFDADGGPRLHIAATQVKENG